jgi:hypothetical protein
MKTVHKYASEMGDGMYKISMLQGAKVIHVNLQKQKGADDAKPSLCLWALVETDQPMKERIFHAVGTGLELPSSLRTDASDTLRNDVGARLADLSRLYLGTTHLDGMVYHLFEEAAR